MRNSRQRNEILRIVRNTNTHPTADWIYDQARMAFPNISLGTVYRNLNQLVEAGLVKSLKDTTVVRYDGNVDPHDHFKCDQCGQIYDLSVTDPTFIDTLNANQPFLIRSFHLELHGICPDCHREAQTHPA
ncbi:MAG: transcriptional repressor [Candidatus Neomarinimicrobiota bacterium]|nr:MAG: transcriptional repressor [Candidatus Neomarinimicrobiota bacterium]